MREQKCERSGCVKTPWGHLVRGPGAAREGLGSTVQDSGDSLMEGPRAGAGLWQESHFANSSSVDGDTQCVTDQEATATAQEGWGGAGLVRRGQKHSGSPFQSSEREDRPIGQGGGRSMGCLQALSQGLWERETNLGR